MQVIHLCLSYSRTWIPIVIFHGLFCVQLLQVIHLCLSYSRTWIPIVIFHGLFFFVFNYLRQVFKRVLDLQNCYYKMYYCLNFLFIIKSQIFNQKNIPPHLKSQNHFNNMTKNHMIYLQYRYRIHSLAHIQPHSDINMFVYTLNQIFLGDILYHN